MKCINPITNLDIPSDRKGSKDFRKELIEDGLWNSFEFMDPVEGIEEVIRGVHDDSLISEIKRASSRGNNIDPDTYTTKTSYELAVRTAAGASAVTRQVWDRQAEVGFALTRPPGHHATRERAMGFCLVNNVAIAAEDLIQNRSAERIAIVDLDVHHGNGTQDIFYNRPDVFYFSTHQYPFYPGTGWYDETGAGAGENTTLNIPLSAHSGDQAYRTSITDVILPVLDRYQPEIILVSLGTDAHWRDPIANLLVSAETYGDCIGLLYQWTLANCGGRLSIVLEGGYDLDSFIESCKAAIAAVSDYQFDDLLGRSSKREDYSWEQEIPQIRRLWKLT